MTEVEARMIELRARRDQLEAHQADLEARIEQLREQIAANRRMLYGALWFVLFGACGALAGFLMTYESFATAATAAGLLVVAVWCMLPLARKLTR